MSHYHCQLIKETTHLIENYCPDSGNLIVLRVSELARQPTMVVKPTKLRLVEASA